MLAYFYLNMMQVIRHIFFCIINIQNPKGKKEYSGLQHNLISGFLKLRVNILTDSGWRYHIFSLYDV
jgi:hypothetical protein